MKNSSDQSYFKSDIAAAKLNVGTSTINNWCNKGVLRGAKKIGGKTTHSSWFIPKCIIEDLVMLLREVEKNYITQKGLEKLLGVSHKAVKNLIDNGEIKLERKFTPFEKWYIDKRSNKIIALLEQKSSIESGEFISQKQVSEQFGLTRRMLSSLRKKDLNNSDEFRFIDSNVYLKKRAVENALLSERIEGFTPLTKVAEMTKQYNNTLRIKCRNGEVSGAFVHNGQWLIPNSYLQEVLNKEEKLKQFMDINEFSNYIGQTHMAIYKKIKRGRIPDFRIIDGLWYIPIKAVSYYKENYEWLKPKEWSLHDSKHYSKETVIKELMARLSQVENKDLNTFNYLYKDYVRNYINKSRSKGDLIRSYANNFFNIYDKIIRLFSQDLNENIEGDLKKVLSLSPASTSLKRQFNTFLRYALAQKGIQLKENLSFSRAVNKDLDEEDDEQIYNPEEYQAFNLYARRINHHIPNAIKSANYANMWLYVLLHLTDVWRKTDFVKKIPQVNIERFGIYQLSWFRENKLTSQQCQQIVNEMYQKLRPEVTNKTGSHLTFLVEPTLIECVAHGVAISEIHRKISNREDLMYTFLPRNGARVNVTRNHYRFFDDEPELKTFRNQKMSRSTLTYFHYHTVEDDADNADIAVAFPKLIRSHDYESTTATYIKAMNRDSSINRVSSNLFKRGHFGWLYNYMIIAAIEGTSKVHTMEQRTNVINDMRNEIAPRDLEEWAIFLKEQSSRKQTVINQLSKMKKEELVGLVRSIFMQEMPAKTKPGQCMVYPNCIYTKRNKCFGCEYFIPQYYVLIEAANEFKRLTKSMNEAKYEATFLRDKRLLLTTLMIFSEAKAIYPHNLLEGFISSRERKEGIDMIRTKEIKE